MSRQLPNQSRTGCGAQPKKAPEATPSGAGILPSRQGEIRHNSASLRPARGTYAVFSLPSAPGSRRGTYDFSDGKVSFQEKSVR